MRIEDATAHLAEQVARARRTMGLERVAPLALPAALAALGWAGACLFGLQDWLPPLAASLGAIAALLAIALLALRGARRWRRPTNQEARARLAQAVALDPTVLEALEDQPSRLDAAGLALWSHAQARALAAAASLKAGPPRLALNRTDPLRLRYVFTAAAAAGLVFAGFNAPDRIERAFLPDPGPLLGDGPIEIEAWAAPASYTGAAPVSLTDEIGKTVRTKPSVDVTVRVTGPVGAPYLKFDGSGGHRAARFVKAADGAYEAHLALPGAGSLRVVRFTTKARWRIEPAVDAKPSAAFDESPRVEGDNVVFTWRARDDYGVRGLFLRLRPLNPPPGLVGAAPIDTPINGGGDDAREAKGAANVNLFTNPYAGMEVKASVVAVDALGQEGESAPASVKLPEKIFLQPLARAAIEIRKVILHERRAYAPIRPLAPGDRPPLLRTYDPLLGTQTAPIMTDEYDPRIERAPAAIRRAGHMLDALTYAPEDGYFQDTAVFLGLRGARAALDVARTIADTGQAGDILWQVALRAEYGDSADARRALEEAQKALAQAIANGADANEIQRLTDAVRQAMNNYVRALVREAQRDQKSQQSEEDTLQKQQLSGQDIQNLLDEVQRLAQAGQTEAAQALLQKLQGLLDNLEVRLTDKGQGSGEGGGGKSAGDSQLDKSMQGLSDTIGKQRALKDETGKQGREGGKSAGKNQDLSQRQEQLRQGLGDARRTARQAGVPDGDDLNKADNAMRRAEEELRRGDYENAERDQNEALNNLRAGVDRLGQEEQRREDARDGRGDKSQRAGERDPLGRTIGAGTADGKDVTVPDAMERKRARDILDELRRRAEDPNRPQAERDYLRRLLESFRGY